MIKILTNSNQSTFFNQLDPRTRLLWMLTVSVIAVIWANPISIIFTSLTLLPIIISAKLSTKIFKFSYKMLPYLFFLFLLQVVPKFIFGGKSETYLFRYKEMDISSAEVNKALVESLRFYIMLISAQIVFLTTNFGEITAAIRQLPPKLRTRSKVSKLKEIIAFLLGMAYQSIPLLNKEIVQITEVQKARGVDVKAGNKFNQVRKLARMGNPLFIRSLELTKGSGLALINFGFSPLQKRSIYRNLKLTKIDYLLLTGLILSLIISFGLKAKNPTW